MITDYRYTISLSAKKSKPSVFFFFNRNLSRKEKTKNGAEKLRFHLSAQQQSTKLQLKDSA